MKNLMVNQKTLLIDAEAADEIVRDLETTDCDVDYTVYNHPDEYVQDYLAQLYLCGNIDQDDEQAQQAVLDNYEEFRDKYIEPYWQSRNPVDIQFTKDAAKFIDHIPDQMTKKLLGWDEDYEDVDDE